MAVEIRELVIKTVVENVQDKESSSKLDFPEQEAIEKMKEEIINECIFRLNQKLRKIKER
ncbi:MAG: DUF5908 family protein [Saprospiraceae bacterium]|nr:DUF5908 family protein [Saprospiraceae bacterium]